ncbi:MAG: LemA family protein [Acidobacteriota bacterium]
MNVLATIAVLVVLVIVAAVLQNKLIARRAAVQNAWTLLQDLLRERDAARAKDLNPSELGSLEQRVMLAERVYNDEARRYNELIATLPWSLLARSAGFKPAKEYKK